MTAKQILTVVVMFLTVFGVMGYLMATAVKMNNQFDALCTNKGGQVIKIKDRHVCAKVEILK